MCKFALVCQSRNSAVREPANAGRPDCDENRISSSSIVCLSSHHHDFGNLILGACALSQFIVKWTAARNSLMGKIEFVAAARSKHKAISKAALWRQL